ncbi:MAG TPA: hypothetical protein PKX87_07340 [Alphaproteobacteria bacterium]|nr:hypothetical protein [Alphaproteobacteria bacterium]
MKIESAQDPSSIDSVFSALTEREAQILIRLPFRVGVWISSSDTTGGAEAEARELKTLETIVSSYAQEYLKSEFVQKLMERTFSAKADWSRWTQGVERVPEECAQLMMRLESLLSARELAAFRENLVDIALAVAMVYREESGSTDTPVSSGGFLDSALRVLGFGRAQEESHVNISLAERKALRQLAAALKVPDPVRAMSR